MTVLELNRAGLLSRQIVAGEKVSEEDACWLFAALWSEWCTDPADEAAWSALARVARVIEDATQI
jgi:hypothetical protein